MPGGPGNRLGAVTAWATRHPALILGVFGFAVLVVYVFRPAVPRERPEFVSHEAQLRVEIVSAPALARVGYQVEERPDHTRILAESRLETCDAPWLKAVYKLCVDHRRRAHGDTSCSVLFHYRNGSCSLP